MARKRSEEILPHVESLALHLRSSIILLYVDETADLKLGHDEVVDINQFMERHRQQVKDTKAYFQTIIDKWRTVGIHRQDADPAMQRGWPISSIRPNRNRSIWWPWPAMARAACQRAFYGSVAVGVLNQIDRPLLLIRSRFVKSTA